MHAMARERERERERERAARCSISCDEQPRRDPPRWYLDRLYAHEKRNLFTTIKRNLREGKCRKAASKRKPVTLLQVQRTRRLIYSRVLHDNVITQLISRL